MKQENKEQIREITKDILLILGASGLVITLALFPGLAYVIDGVWKKRKYNERRFNYTLKRLQDQKMITIGQKGDKTVIELTKKGKKRVLKYKLDEMKIKKPKKWDGLWRIVIFDIPEKKKIARDALRRKLKELDFVKIQKSVFVHPYPCRDEIDFIKEIFEVRPYVNLIIAKSIDGEARLKCHFKLLDSKIDN
jgi:DNA-binding transcriptional regulator PaaX